MLKKAKYKGKQKSGGFKGFPLIDFLHPNTLKMEGVFTHPILQNALANHIKAFTTRVSPNTAKDVGSVASTTVDTTGIDRAGNPIGVNDLMANPATSNPSFEEKLTDFLEGLYLGNFTSHAVRPVLRRPPIQYIYEIGLNTDKDTGFIVKNPFDTLITFGPRDAKYPYGENTAIPERIAKLPFMSYATGVSDNDCVKETPRDFNIAAEITTVSRPNKALKDDKPVKSAVVCDLNLRIILDSKGRLQSLSIYGDTLKLHLSKGLVQTVKKTDAGAWVKTGKRMGISVGNRIITLKKNRLPNWGGAIDLEGAAVSITSSGLIGRLNKVNIGGTLDKPLIIFDKVEILK